MKRLTLLWVFLFTIQVFAQTQKVIMTFSVLDEKKNFVDNLTASELQILQGKNNLQIEKFEMQKESSLDAVILIDTSMSQTNIFPSLKEVANLFIKSHLTTKNNRVAVVSTSSKFRVEKNLDSDFTLATITINGLKVDTPKQFEGLQRGCSNRSVGPSNPNDVVVFKLETTLWDSLLSIHKNNVFDMQSSARKILILISDGIDKTNKIKKKEVAEFMNSNQISIYPIGIYDNCAEIDTNSLHMMATITGGSANTIRKVKQIVPILKEIENSARYSYQIIFATEDLQKDVRIKLQNPIFAKRKLKIIQNKPILLQN